MLGSSRVAAQVAASQEGLSSMSELATERRERNTHSLRRAVLDNFIRMDRALQ
jgi:hypothetical protein